MIRTFSTLTMIVLLLSGCSFYPFLASDRVQIASSATDDILIGVAWPFSEQGDGFNEGLDLAVEQVNADGGVLGRPIQLLKRDDQARATEGLVIAGRPALRSIMKKSFVRRRSRSAFSSIRIACSKCC